MGVSWLREKRTHAPHLSGTTSPGLGHTKDDLHAPTTLGHPTLLVTSLTSLSYQPLGIPDGMRQNGFGRGG